MIAASGYRPITIDVVDRAVRDWFDKIVDAHVLGATEDRKKVPVTISSGERWATSRKGIRDKDGVLILPLLAVRRTAIDTGSNMSALGTYVPYIRVSRRIASPKTGLVRNSLAAREEVAMRGGRGAPIFETVTIPFPDVAVTNYELVCQAQYVVQLNDIVQKILTKTQPNVAVPTFVIPAGDVPLPPTSPQESFERRAGPAGYYFVGFFDPGFGDSSNFEEFTDTERMVRCTASFRVPTYLQLDQEGTEPAVRVRTSANEVGLEEVLVDDRADVERIFGKGG